VIFDRSWYNRAGVERVMGFLRRVKNRWGRIINIASVAGVRAVGTGRTAYGTSKGAVIALTRQMAVELCDYGITANAIAPGPVDTPID
jgi:NAD(P)-dependent dehydrogenase (short-subunit alcohol dehydrogenase family)